MKISIFERWKQFKEEFTEFFDYKSDLNLPFIDKNFESSRNEIYIAGGLAGIPLLKNVINHGNKLVGDIFTNGYKQSNDKKKNYDLIIIGGGACGISAGLAAQKKGLKVIVLEKNRTFDTIRNYSKGKKIYDEPKSVKNESHLWFESTVKEELLEKWDTIVEKSCLEIITNCQVKKIEGEGPFKISTNKGLFTANKIILSIGIQGNPRMHEIDNNGNANIRYQLNDPELFENKNILMIGGGDNAVESSIILSKNNRVTLSYRRRHFFRLIPENKNQIDSLIKSGEIKVIFNSKVTKLSNNEAELDINGKKENIEVDEVFAFLGTKPPLKFLKENNIKTIGGLSTSENFKETIRKKSTLKTTLLLLIFGALFSAFYYHVKYRSAVLNEKSFILGQNSGFFYITIYTILVVTMGIYVILKYKLDTHITVRTLSLMTIQISIGYILVYPKFSYIFSPFKNHIQPHWTYYQLVYVWPLELQPLVWNIKQPDWLLNVDLFLPYVIFSSFLMFPLISLIWGKRIFCSWICGCGALAETAGEPFRKKALKNQFSYKLEWIKYIILLITVFLTIYMLKENIYSSNNSQENYGHSYFVYWFVVLFLLSSIIGVGLYPVWGGRIWCRFFCPMAAFLSIFSVLGRNEIKTYKERCIACNKCNETCEMGIDIKNRALIGKSVNGRECVGCGVCIYRCPTDALEFRKRRKIFG